MQLQGPAPQSDLPLITDLVRSPDGLTLATVSDNKAVKLWDARTGQLLQALQTGKDEWFFSPSFSPDGSVLATASSTSTFNKQYGRVQLWNPSTGARITTVEDISWPKCVQFSPLGNFIAVGATSDLYVVDTSNYALVQRLQRPHDRAVLATMSFDHSGNLLATAGQDGTIKLWKMPLLEPVRTFSVATPFVKISVPQEGSAPVPAASVAFSHDDKLLAANNAEGTVYVWDVATGNELMRYAYGKLGHGESIAGTVHNSLAFTPDDQWLITTDRTGAALRLLGVTSKKEAATPLATHTDSAIIAFDASLPNDTVAFGYRVYAPGQPATGKFEIWTLSPQ
jgi:WD40 repeat protein